jgi:signal peptidase II
MSARADARWLWLSLASVVVDRATKFAIERYTSPFFRLPIVSDIVVLVHTKNPGIAFSLFSDSNSRWLTPLLLLSSTAVMAVLAWMLVTGRAGGRLGSAGIALILGGAAGNALDRVLHGGVTDFIEVRLGTYRWPAFNVADSVISIGAALVLCDLLFARGDR